MKPRGKIIEGSKVYLEYLTPEMVCPEYVGWMNDSEVNRYLEARFDAPYTLESLRNFVKKQWEDEDTHMFAIKLKTDHTYIGNIKVGPVNKHHLFAWVGIVIGEKKAWGKGYATDAIKIVSEYCFEKLGLHKLLASFYEPNKGSNRAFLNAGYEFEGKVKNKFLCGSTYVDYVIVGKTKSDRGKSPVSV